MRKNKKKKEMRARRRERASYETLARVTLPFTLDPLLPPCSLPFLRIFHWRGVSLAGFSRDFVLAHGPAEDRGTSRTRDPICTANKSVSMLEGVGGSAFALC